MVNYREILRMTADGSYGVRQIKADAHCSYEKCKCQALFYMTWLQIPANRNTYSVIIGTLIPLRSVRLFRT